MQSILSKKPYFQEWNFTPFLPRGKQENKKWKGGRIIDIYLTILSSYFMNLNTIYIFYNKSIAFCIFLFTWQIYYFVYTFRVILLMILGDMHNKNISQNKNSQEKPASSSRFVDLATRAAIIASIFSSSPNYSQIIKNSPDLQKKNTIELVDKNPDRQQQKNSASHSGMLELVQKGGNIEHQKIIKKKISDILSGYGQEQWMEIIRKHLLIEINTARAKVQAPAMKLDTTLTRMAQGHAQDMKKNNYFDHTDSQWRHIWDRAKDAGYQYSVISENIANDNTIEGVISGFVQSKMGGHERILSREYEYIGFWVEEYYDGNKKWYAYFVLDFASPLK